MDFRLFRSAVGPNQNETGVKQCSLPSPGGNLLPTGRSAEAQKVLNEYILRGAGLRRNLPSILTRVSVHQRNTSE